MVFRLGVLGIGDIALTTLNAEVWTLISQRMQRQSPMANTVMVTLANGRANSWPTPGASPNLLPTHSQRFLRLQAFSGSACPYGVPPSVPAPEAGTTRPRLRHDNFFTLAC